MNNKNSLLKRHQFTYHPAGVAQVGDFDLHVGHHLRDGIDDHLAGLGGQLRGDQVDVHGTRAGGGILVARPVLPVAHDLRDPLVLAGLVWMAVALLSPVLLLLLRLRRLCLLRDFFL